jgi:uncharacterized membrane protein YhaH (DUF805 family)
VVLIKISDLWIWKKGLSRGHYAIWGMLLFAIKYSLDRFVSYYIYDRKWFLSDYFMLIDYAALTRLSPEDISFYTVLLFISLPFIWAGTFLTVKRLRDVGASGWAVILFFIPLVNLFLFAILALIPTMQASTDETEIVSLKKDSSILYKMRSVLPNNKIGNAAIAVAIVCMVALILSFISISFIGEYGWGLFVGVPFFLGLGSVLLYCVHQHRSLKECISVSVLSVSIFSGLLLILAMEGLICLIMAAPIGFVIAMIGGLIGYWFQKTDHSSPSAFILIMFMIPIVIGFESSGQKDTPLFEVRSEVVIQASAQTVWDHLVTFELEEPHELLFKTGISYPINAEIEGTGVDAIRYCNFNTGAFVEPIEVWDEPRLLQFSVLSQPEPLTELSPYKELKLPHLEGYFNSKKGQFEIIPLLDGQVKLVGTTWYEHDIDPAFYWKWWSDEIIHQIHLRVLNHIKITAEEDSFILD